MTTDIRYESYVPMIQKLSGAYSRRSAFSQETLVSEANLIFAKCLNDFDPARAKFSTHLYFKISHHYKDMIKLQNKVERNKVMSVETCSESSRATDYICEEKSCLERELEKRDCYTKLSEEAKELVCLILNGPQEIINDLVSPVRKVFNKRRILKYVEKQFGLRKAKKIFREIEEFVSTF